MYPVLGTCPVCDGEMIVTRLQCTSCGSELTGAFGLERVYYLDPEQRRFLETFIKHRGNVVKVKDELGMSYPTARDRLSDVISALGYETVEEPASSVSEEQRKSVLGDLADGKITPEEAIELLQGG